MRKHEGDMRGEVLQSPREYRCYLNSMRSVWRIAPQAELETERGEPWKSFEIPGPAPSSWVAYMALWWGSRPWLAPDIRSRVVFPP